MLSEEAERCLPYSPEQLFDLVADVERYPEFLRWWISARVWRRRVDTYYTRCWVSALFTCGSGRKRSSIGRSGLT